MAHISESSVIQGVYIVQLKAFSDERGRFMETFRKEWFPMRDWGAVQNNRSDSQANVVRGLHYHFNQVDYWYVPFGTVRAALFDMRRSSPTFKAVQTVEMGTANEVGLYIPSGVAHGFAALTDATLMYVVDQYYNPADEYGVLWNDPALGIDWGVTAPILSDRDAANPRLDDIPAEDWPA